MEYCWSLQVSTQNENTAHVFQAKYKILNSCKLPVPRSFQMSLSESSIRASHLNVRMAKAWRVQKQKEFTIQLSQGQETPCRILFGQAQTKLSLGDTNSCNFDQREYR